MNTENMKLLDRINTEYMEQKRIVKTKFFIDIECLIDFRMTALLCIVPMAEYGIVKHNLKFYNIRTSTKTVSYFPGISVTDDDIDKYLVSMYSDPSKMAQFVKFLQYTTYIGELCALLTTIEGSNRLIKSDSVIDLLIGGQFYVPKGVVEYLLQRFKHSIPNAYVHYTPKDILKMPSAIIASFQHFSIYDFERVVNHPKFTTPWSDGTLLGFSVHAHPFVTTTGMGDNVEQLAILDNEQKLDNTDKFLNLFFDYAPIPIRIGSNERQ